ncbi:short/branched chain specific acyl-CoA dehydrogenase, mitochondrial-like [Symsagittifera roscoffensis]|uniref:short/branched chain specific acyl-CoA dehydrogenase, mitochondrial-like n=1 Tax=Symsagittifera roscoffensis TaxID=84072 RepID=UPI00307C7940
MFVSAGTRIAQKSFSCLAKASNFCSLRLLSNANTRDINDMEFSFAPLTSISEDEKSIQEAVEKFANERLKPLVRKMDENANMDQGLIDELFANGFMGIEVPVNYGGVGSSFFSSILAVEEVARVDPSVAILVDIHNTLITTVIMQHGNEEQKKYWLPKLVSDTVGSFCLSEATSGSDAFAMKTVAKPDGKGNYVINGTKLWISNSEQAGLFVVFANTDPSKGYKGITAFLVPRDTPGLTIGKKEDKMCIRASSTCPLHFENVMVCIETRTMLKIFTLARLRA